MRCSTNLCLLLATALAWVPSVAIAQTQAESDERARLHFEAGRSHFEQGSYESALPEFEAAYELSQRPALLFNIGATLERLARYGEAADHFERFLAQTPDYPQRAELESRIANDRRRAAEGGGGGGDQVVHNGETHPRGPSDLVWVGVTALSVAAAGGITAGILGGLALAEEDNVRNGCFADGTCTPDDVSGIDDLALGADAAGTASAILAAAGVAVIGLAHIGASEEVPVEEARVTPMAGPTYAGLQVEGRFR